MNLLNESSDLKFLTRNRNNDRDQSNSNYEAGDEIIYNTEVLKNNPGDYNNAYILLRGDIIVIVDN